MNMMHPEEVVPGVRNFDALERLSAAERAAAEALPPMISTDSHLMEPESVWERLPSPQREQVQQLIAKAGFFNRAMPAGAGEPHARITVQEQDGVAAEILFPNNGMAIFGMEREVQEVAFPIYNDWLAEFCSVAPKRFFGVPCVSVYNIDGAVDELHRSLNNGLTGVMVWQVPDPALPFTTRHYDPLWKAAADAEAPVHMHILTGHSYARSHQSTVGYEKIRGSVNHKQNDTINALFDMLFSGVFTRFPKLRLVLAESECGWLPFILQQWDYYYHRFKNKDELPIDRKPSEIFFDHVYCTWLEDYSGTRQFTWWGQDNLMWSNDFPHSNTTFPHSRNNVIRHIGNLAHDVQMKLIRDNAIQLYRLDGRLEVN
jgi:uncharacterized protein